MTKKELKQLIGECINEVSNETMMARAETARNDNIIKEKIRNLLSSGIKVTMFRSKIGNISSPIVENGGRRIVLVDMGNINLPFYCSTGDGGKENVEAGKWYPIFGITPTWFNKTTEYAINDYYGSSKAKDIAKKLDNILGDLRRIWSPHIVSHNVIENFFNIINQDLSPSDKGDQKFREKFIDNVKNVLAKIGGTLGMRLENIDGTKGIDIKINTEIGRNVIKHLVGDDYKFFSNTQFKLEKGTKWGWFITPDSTAINSTNLNGKPITEKTALNLNDVISLGKSGKGKIKVIN
jgi:hypothetical protein